MHFPEGGVPKEGPSAGIAVATALLSALLQVPVLPLVALTGEITLTGQVLPVGGLKEKMLAALREGVQRSSCPARWRPRSTSCRWSSRRAWRSSTWTPSSTCCRMCWRASRSEEGTRRRMAEVSMEARYAPHEVEERLMKAWLARSAFHASADDPRPVLRHLHPAAERHRVAPHGARPQRHHPGHPHPLSPPARLQHPVGGRHRPRRHRHAEQGGGPIGRRGPAQGGPGPGGVREAGVEVAGGVRLHHHPPAQAPGLRLRLRVRALHHGRGLPRGGGQGLRGPLREGRHLPRRLPGQLVHPLRLGHLRPGGGARGPGGQALLRQVPGGRLGRES